MRLCFDPVMCPKAVLPAALKIAKAAGFDAMVLHCAFTASSPFHPDAFGEDDSRFISMMRVWC